MASLSDTPRKKRSRTLCVRFVGDNDVGEIIKPVKDTLNFPLEKENESTVGTPRSRRRTRKVSVEVKEHHQEDQVESLPTSNVAKSDCEEDEEVGAVEGKQLYEFRTPKSQKGKMGSSKLHPSTPKSRKKEGNDLNANETPKSSNKRNHNSVNGTPKPVKDLKVALELENSKTPYNLRRKIKKCIDKILIEEEVSDFSSSESEYNQSDSDESSEGGETEEEALPTGLKPVAASRRDGLSCTYSAEDYFSYHKSAKPKTSNHTLSRLKTPKLSETALKEMVKTMELHHEKNLTKLNMDLQKYFGKWLFCMRQGHGVLLYGMGSKRSVLNNFHELVLRDSQVVVMNGFFPGLTMKKILNCITEEIMGLMSNPVGLFDCVRLIESAYNSDSSEELFLIVHNLDGALFRNEQNQTVLSKLSSVKNIHVIASVDHIHSPLLWDPVKLNAFNFVWFDTTTLLPYIDETSIENSVMVKQSGALALSSLKSVYNSLTVNAKGVFLIISKHQLEQRGNPNCTGISFRDVYWKSREAFLLSSDLALRAQLTEFLDHHIMKSRTGTDGDERLSIPIDHSILQDFIEEVDGS